MKLIIEIDKYTYNHIIDGTEDSRDEAEALYRIKNGKVIPDNATNGDMIKALFDVKEIEEMKHCVFVTIYPDYDTRFIKDWWNAPYKKGEQE